MTSRLTPIRARALPWPVLGIALILVAGVLVGEAGVARAQTPAGGGASPAPPANQPTIDRLVQMNKKALDDYDTLEWDSAKRTLLEALVLGKKSGLENHPVLARTYIHLGAVYVTGFKDKQKGMQSFVRALEIDPTITIQKSMLTADLTEVFAQAARQARPAPTPPPVVAAPAAPPPPPKPAPVVTPPVPAPAPPPPPPVATVRRSPVPADGEVPPPPPPPAAGGKGDDDESGEPDLPVHINALDCPTSDETPAGKGVSVRCAVAPELGASTVVLYYREPGKEEFVVGGMEKTPKGWYVGRIPRKAVSGKAVQFYFEARDASGKAIASNGRSDSPNLILIRDKNSGGDEEEEGARGDADENPLDTPVSTESPFGRRRWWFGLMAGSGIGKAQGDGPEARTDLRKNFIPGGALSSVHLAPEIGIHVSRLVALSVLGRLEYIPQPKKYERYTATGAQSVLARVLVFTPPARVRVYGSAMFGGGEGFRLIIYPDRTRPDFKDTVRGGPYLAGVGGGLTIELARVFSLVLEVNGLMGFPITSYVVDGNAGFQFNF